MKEIYDRYAMNACYEVAMLHHMMKVETCNLNKELHNMRDTPVSNSKIFVSKPLKNRMCNVIIDESVLSIGFFNLRKYNLF